jgi:Arc/MetJ-type ribon-helix-helix transcriptional regulator
MASPITLRLDPELRRRVERIARRKRTTTSSVLREAVTTWVAREESAGSIYDSIKDLIGGVHGGDPGRSTRKLSEVLKARRTK